MKKDIMLLGWIAIQAALIAATIRSAVAAEIPPVRPVVDVVFVLDTTGSMGGLLEGAKRRVWSIANELSKGRPSPRLRMGLVAFRDKGDSYVTKAFDLTGNLDQVYKDLLTLEAGGGGDGPEHVLQGLSDAIDKMSWSSEAKAVKAIYLVGDASPHEDYGDTPSLKELLQKAVRKGLVVNAAQCGSDSTAGDAFRLVARLGEGRFLPVPQDGGMAAVETPFDARMAELGRKLDSTIVAYGARKSEAAGVRGLAMCVSAKASGAAGADRAAYRGGAGFDSELDLVAAYEEKRISAGKLKDSELPGEFRGLSSEERERRLRRASEERRRLRDEVAELSKKRENFLRKKSGPSPKEDSFDRLMVESLREQARRKDVKF